MQSVHVDSEKMDSKPLLSGISLEVKKESLVAVVGESGSGKSLLLNAIIGELDKARGRVLVSGRLAYVPQEPWILNATVRENILLGSPYNRELYQKVFLLKATYTILQVLYSCCLDRDIEILSLGDMTTAGDLNLSGGQKARISLARALYQNCDVYLLDDPLSAVDSQVKRHIFEYVS